MSHLFVLIGPIIARFLQVLWFPVPYCDRSSSPKSYNVGARFVGTVDWLQSPVTKYLFL